MERSSADELSLLTRVEHILTKWELNSFAFERLLVRSELDGDFTGPMVERLLLPWKDLTSHQNSLLNLALVGLLLR